MWCHNPECIAPRPQLRYIASRCTACERCEAVCPRGVHRFGAEGHILRRDDCSQCGRCVDACPMEALAITGKHMSVDDVMHPVLQDLRYYAHSGGGLTVSGGEPMMQLDFLAALLASAKKNGLHTAIETSGCMPCAAFERIAPLTDLFLFDYKETDPALHRVFTGRDNLQILVNLDWLMAHGASVTLRCPLIPGCNLRREHLQGILALTQRYPRLCGVELMAYHKIGVSKYKELGLTYQVDAAEMTQEYKDELLSWMQERSAVSIQWG